MLMCGGERAHHRVESLDISFNAISTFPPKMEYMESLQRLYCNNNRFVQAPYHVPNLGALVGLCHSSLRAIVLL